MEYSKVDIHKTHPNLYYGMMILSVMRVLLAVNFWTSSPTFNPFSINKHYVGIVFFVIGFSQLVFLNLYRNLHWIRRIQTLSLVVLIMWGMGNMQQSFAGKASFQLPIFCIGLALLHIPMILEPPINPMTERKQ